MKRCERKLLSLNCVMMLFAAMPFAVCAEETAPRRLYSETAIVCSNEPAAWVVYPSGTPGYLEMAGKIAAAVKAKTGVDIKLLPDTEVAETNHPVLLDQYRNRNLILLGRLGINRAIWGVYNRFLCAVDGYYPGGDGYVVRTAANVYKNGANTIIAGGSSDKGAVRAADRLAEIIAATPCKAGNLVLPWLLDVELGGECKKAFDDDEQRQMARIFPGAPGEDPHNCHPVKRFYENIMGWYWSGRESYMKLGLRFLDLLLEEDDKITDANKRGITGHYAAEFFVRAYDMADDSGRLGAGQIDRVDRAIIDGFYNIIGRDERESEYRKVLMKEDGKSNDLRPADEIVMGSHQNSMWLADKVYADFILGTIPETPGSAHIHKEARSRRSLYVKGFDALIADRWREDENDTTPMGTLFRYALEMERYALFFDSGNARKTALYKLIRTANPMCLDIGLMRDHTFRRIDYGIYACIMASYYNDGEFKQVIETMPGSAAGFYGQYLNGVHRYSPGPEVKAVPPVSLTGAVSIPLEPLHYRRMKCTLPYEKTFNFASIRGGFTNDDYLLMCGGLDLPGNTIVRVASRGKIWLSHTSNMKMFDQNALYISQCSKLNLENKPLPAAARMEHATSAKDAAYISSTLLGYAGTDWNRQVVWLAGRFFIVFDTVTALEPDRYQVMASWRPNLYTFGEGEKLKPAAGGEGRLEGDRWVARGDGTSFTIACAGDGIRMTADADVDSVTRQSIPVCRQRLTADLKKGESARIANLLFSADTNSNINYELRMTEGGGLLVRATGSHDSIYYMGPMPAQLGGSDAPLVVVAANKLTAFAAGTLKVEGKTLSENGPAKTREAELDDAAARKMLRGMWDSGKISGPVAAAAGDSGSSPEENHSAQWYKIFFNKIFGDGSRKEGLRREWRYTGAQQPGLIAGATLIATNTWDLGSVVDLSQVSVRLGHELSWEDRNVKGLRWSAAGQVCTQVFISADGKEDSFKPFRGEVADIAVPDMGGYGRITKKENVYQVLRGRPQKARYVRVIAGQPLQAQEYLFYDAARPDENGEPLRAQVVALRDKDKPDILIYPDIWPGFRRVTRLAHAVYALDAGGSELWRQKMKWRIFFVRALDRDGKGLKKIFVGSLDNNVYVYDGEGKLSDTLTVEDSYAPGAPNAGYPLAPCIGLWQPDETGRRKLVLPRYHRISFLASDGRAEGHASPGARCPFWINDVLETGVDFTGDGIEDSVAMSTSEILPLTQDVIKAGKFPALGLPNDGADAGLLSGPPTLAFHLFGTESNTLFIARQNLVAIFDLKNKKWLMSWAPETPITAAVALPEHRQILCCTRDGILWRIKLAENSAVAGVETAPASVMFNRFAVLDRKQGAVAASSPGGIFRIGTNNCPVLLVPGSFVDVDVYPSDTAAKKIITVDKTGAVESYRLK